jgi:hypothetical protein
MRFNFEIVQIHAAENDAGVWRGGSKANAAGYRSVKANSGCFDRALYSCLTGHTFV